MDKEYISNQLNIICNQTLDPNGGDIIIGRIILPIVGFKTVVLMNAPFGKLCKTIGGILMDIQKKFWIGMLLYLIVSWCLAFYILRIIY